MALLVQLACLYAQLSQPVIQAYLQKYIRRLGVALPPCGWFETMIGPIFPGTSLMDWLGICNRTLQQLSIWHESDFKTQTNYRPKRRHISADVINQVLTLRYGDDLDQNCPARTFREVGNLLGMTPVQVWQICKEQLGDQYIILKYKKNPMNDPEIASYICSEEFLNATADMSMQERVQFLEKEKGITVLYHTLRWFMIRRGLFTPQVGLKACPGQIGPPGSRPISQLEKIADQLCSDEFLKRTAGLSCEKRAFIIEKELGVKVKKDVVKEFYKRHGFYGSEQWGDSKWMGVPNKRKITREMAEYLLSESVMARHNDLTFPQRAVELEQLFGVKMDHSSLRQWLIKRIPGLIKFPKKDQDILPGDQRKIAVEHLLLPDTLTRWHGFSSAQRVAHLKMETGIQMTPKNLMRIYQRNGIRIKFDITYPSDDGPVSYKSPSLSSKVPQDCIEYVLRDDVQQRWQGLSSVQRAQKLQEETDYKIDPKRLLKIYNRRGVKLSQRSTADASQ